ncbi:MAG: YlxR family protein [Actinobacteria bacterium]|nr:YlxR family protein [Actinomycetota bacterium]
MIKKKIGHIPERTCLACGRKSSKKDFLRIVRTKEGNIIVTNDKRVQGRSAYICHTVGCVENSVKKLERVFKIKINEEEKTRVRKELLALLEGRGEDADEKNESL